MGRGLTSWEIPIIWDQQTKDEYLSYGADEEEYDRIKDEVLKYSKKCDKVVKDYEKKTGKKIRISGYYESFEQEIKEKQRGK